MAPFEPGDPQRDKLLSRLLAESLAAPVANGGVCPDAETMAAYADRSITIEQAAQLDAHSAECARCQKVLAALAVSLEALPEDITAQLQELPTLATIPSMNIRPNTPTSIQANIQRPGQSLHPARTTAPTSRPVLPPRTAPPGQPTLWRQLAPALGIAAAVALWLALRPAPLPQTLSAQLEAQKEISATQTPGAGSDSEIAEANIPAPPRTGRAPAAPTTPAPPSSRESQQLDALKTSEPAPETRAAAAGSQPAGPQPGGAPSPQSLQAERSFVPATNSKTVTVTGDLPALNNTNTQLGGTLGRPAVGELPVEPRNYSYLVPTPPGQIATTGELRAASSAPVSRGETATGSGAVSALTARPVASTRAAVPASSFASPSGDRLWRIGAAGSIERSADRGQTWGKQVSGVLSDLVAGAAASNDAAWIVGRAGVILRTTDGAHWQRVSLPAIAANPATMQSATTNTAASSADVSPAKTLPAAAPRATTSSAVASSGTANGAALDLAGVEARDALHATVIVAGGRRFTTSDGGQTWTAQ